LSSTTPRRRPGGRSAETARRIFDATLALLVEGGLPACGYGAIAERAGVGRATLYRRWPHRAVLVADALAARLEDAIRAPDSGSFADDLRLLLSEVAAFLQSPLGRAAVAAAATQSPEEASGRTRFWEVRLSSATPILDRAVARGEFPPDGDREALLACAMGALYFRLLVMARPIDAAWLERIARQVVDGLRMGAGRAIGSGA